MPNLVRLSAFRFLCQFDDALLIRCLPWGRHARGRCVAFFQGDFHTDPSTRHVVAGVLVVVLFACFAFLSSPLDREERYEALF